MLKTHVKPMEKEIKLRINACYGDLRPSEKKAADYVLKHLDELKNLSLDRLAENAGVSQPTVIRMIKALGYGGYKEFRYTVVERLAAASTNTAGFEAMYGYTLAGNENIEDIPAKIIATTGSMAGEMLKNISMKTFSRVIEKLKDAQRIDIYSVENSNVIAEDLLTKLMYLGLNAGHFTDSYHQRISAGNLHPGDIALGISYSGNSKDTVDAVAAAKKAGATVIVITNFRDSLITRYADLVLCTGQEQVFYGNAIFSRTTQVMLVDMIYMALLASDYKKYVKALNRNGHVAMDKAYLP
mgnify:CR=1 FL=1